MSANMRSPLGDLHHVPAAARLHFLHPLLHFAGEFEQRLGVWVPLALQYHRMSAIAALPYVGIELDISQERDAELPRSEFAATLREHVDLVVAMRADEVAHVFYQPEDVDLHLPEHFNCLA